MIDSWVYGLELDPAAPPPHHTTSAKQQRSYLQYFDFVFVQWEGVEMRSSYVNGQNVFRNAQFQIKEVHVCKLLNQCYRYIKEGLCDCDQVPETLMPAKITKKA